MTRNKYILVSFVIAFIFGIPFKWIQYKGEETISFFQLFDLGVNHLFFDGWLLAANTLIIFIVLSCTLKLKSRIKPL
ncbi:hypothetical protein U5N28_16055 [Lysinibacillus telephonicus]|uniref:Uncharacterized protein n=2 Tax=Lysinibacillus telephonicus TaxID=1714840 RepID=A0A3S0HMS3_9BACI|nr:hypothetical protein [Lysinibacillus telephonicus]RTQ93344.1 hypothetical protein EKG35_08940 [Lysinibacillus telephonicus]